MGAVWLCVIFATLPLTAAEEKKGPESPDLPASAKRFVELLQQGDFASAVQFRSSVEG